METHGHGVSVGISYHVDGSVRIDDSLSYTDANGSRSLPSIRGGSVSVSTKTTNKSRSSAASHSRCVREQFRLCRW